MLGIDRLFISAQSFTGWREHLRTLSKFKFRRPGGGLRLTRNFAGANGAASSPESTGGATDVLSDMAGPASGNADRLAGGKETVGEGDAPPGAGVGAASIMLQNDCPNTKGWPSP